MGGQKEWIVIAVLIVYLAFVPTLSVVRDLLASPVGKAVALAGIVYVWKFFSEPVALLLVVALLRSGGIREFMDNKSKLPPGVVALCEEGWELENGKCKKGDETKSPVECAEGQTLKEGKCSKGGDDESPSAPGPSGGTTGAAAAMAALKELQSKGATVEGFSSLRPVDFSPV